MESIERDIYEELSGMRISLSSWSIKIRKYTEENAVSLDKQSDLNYYLRDFDLGCKQIDTLISNYHADICRDLARLVALLRKRSMKINYNDTASTMLTISDMICDITSFIHMYEL